MEHRAVCSQCGACPCFYSDTANHSHACTRCHTAMINGQLQPRLPADRMNDQLARACKIPVDAFDLAVRAYGLPAVLRAAGLLS